MLHMNYWSRFGCVRDPMLCMLMYMSVLQYNSLCWMLLPTTTLVVFSAPVALVVRCVYFEQPHITILNIVHSLQT